MAVEARRQADVYVFALLAHQDKTTLDPMNLAQWEFLVLPTVTLNTQRPLQSRLTLASLLKLSPERCGFADLQSAVERAAGAV